MKRLILISASALIASSAFAQTKCVTAPVNITGNQVTLTSSGDKSATNTQVYIYYAKKHAKRHDHAYPIGAIGDKYPSTPILVNTDKVVTAMPETYNVSLTMPQNTVAVCPDSALNVAANINVEKVSSYTGYYPNSDTKIYKKVTKREYKMVARKMRKIKRNEANIARKTGNDVDVRTAKA